VLRARGRHSGAEAAMPMAHLVRWRNDLAVYAKSYTHQRQGACAWRTRLALVSVRPGRRVPSGATAGLGCRGSCADLGTYRGHVSEMAHLRPNKNPASAGLRQVGRGGLEPPTLD
jgi:hypothetical protein